MYRSVLLKRLLSSARLGRGSCQPSHGLAFRNAACVCPAPACAPALHTCAARPRPPWQRPTAAAVLAQASQQPVTTQQILQQQQHPYGQLPGSAAALSSLSSASELSAAIADAPTPAALQGLAAAAAGGQQQGWPALEYKVQLLASMEDQDPALLAKVLWFYAKLGPGHADLFQAAIPVFYNSLGQLSPHDLLRLLTALSAAAQHTPAAYCQELYAAATEFLWDGLGELEPAALADVAWAYAAVDHYDDDEDFFGGLAAAAQRRLEHFCPEDISRLLASLATLRFSAPDLCAAALQQMGEQVESWPLSCVGRLLWSLAVVQAPADPCTLDRVAQHVSVVLRNLRTSTDGQRVLAGLGARGNGGGAPDDAPLPGLAHGQHGGGGGGGGAAAGSSPTWQGFGMSRNSSGRSGSSGSSGGGGSSSETAAAPPHDGAASIWAAANNDPGFYENQPYESEPRQEPRPQPAAGREQQQQHQGEQPQPQPQQGEEESPLGPDFVAVTTHLGDGRTTTTYVRRAAAAGNGGAGGPGGGSGGNGGPPAPPAGSRGASTAAGRGSARSWYVQPGALRAQPLALDDCPGAWAAQPVSPDCRPVYDDAEALQGALVCAVWALAALGHLHSGMAKEGFKALALVGAEAFTEEQLGLLWGAHMRYQQLGHIMLDPNPLLAESYSVYLKELSRASPRTISLPSHLQPLAAATWLLHSVRASPEYQELQAQGGQQQPQQRFSSWRFRDPAVLTAGGLEHSVRQALQYLGLPVGNPCMTLDGLERVGLPMRHNGVSVAWQVVPPACCSRNPPHAPTAEAQMHKWALQYRGYTVLQVPFNEWAAVLESGDAAVQAGFLQSRLNGLSVRIQQMPNF